MIHPTPFSYLNVSLINTNLFLFFSNKKFIKQEHAKLIPMVRRKSSGMRYDIKAVGNNDGIYGITRVSVTRKEQDSLPVELQGMCLFFETDREGVCNYPVHVKINNLSEYEVYPLLPKGEPVVKKPYRDQYFLIPVSEMGYSMKFSLEQQRFQLAQQCGIQTKRSLQTLLSKLIVEKITENMSGFNSTFKKFPKELAEDAKREGAYYRKNNSHDSNNTPALFPDLHPTEMPFGFLPSWAMKLVERTKIE